MWYFLKCPAPMQVPRVHHNLESTEFNEFLELKNKFIFPGITLTRPFVWHPQTNPFPKTKLDRFNRKKTISKNGGHSTRSCIEATGGILAHFWGKNDFSPQKCA
jgi:hypothetical protein